MTPQQVKVAIANSPIVDWCNNINERFNFAYIDIKPTFTTVASLYEFVDNQLAGWNQLNNDVMPTEVYQNSIGQWNGLKVHLSKFITDYLPTTDKNPANDFWVNQIQPIIRNVASSSFTYDCSEIDLIYNLSKKNATIGQGAYLYFTGNLSNIQNREIFNGVVHAFNLRNRESTILKEQEKTEESRLSELKDQYQRLIAETDKHLIDHISNNNRRVQELVDEVKRNKDKAESDSELWFVETKDTFNEFYTLCNNRQIELSNLYEEKLRMEKPAEYWKKRAIKLNTEGWIALRWLVGLLIFACLTLYFLLWQTPEGMLKSFFSEDKGIAIKWSIVYVTFISLIAFGIRAISKVMFSSFHLARDAEEREQLAYVYLALIKDKAMDKEDRTLIMQSLFSRADSGLLKEDSSPTMPGLANKLIQ
jgi:hypothetical protein